MYPSLTNFSIQSSRIIRFGFLGWTVTLADIEYMSEYRNYIVSLVSKHVPSTANSIVGGSKKHYELLLRKLELNRLLAHDRVHIAPISIDGRGNGGGATPPPLPKCCKFLYLKK